MAFIGLAIVIVGWFLFTLFGILLTAAGIIINKKTKYKKIGFCMSVLGGLMVTPMLVFVAVQFYIRLYNTAGRFLPTLSGILLAAAGIIINKKTKYKKIGSFTGVLGGLVAVPMLAYIIFDFFI